MNTCRAVPIALLSLAAAITGCGGSGSSGGGNSVGGGDVNDALFGGPLMFIGAQLRIYGGTFLDFDGDGLDDAVGTAEIFVPTISLDYEVMFHHGSDTEIFEAPVSLGEGQLIGTGDFNGDGLVDIASFSIREVISPSNKISGIAVRLGRTGGVFDDPVFIDRPENGWSQLSKIADFDGDGDADIAFLIDSRELVTLMSNGDGATFTEHNMTFPPYLELLAAVDLNGDTFADLVTYWNTPATVNVAVLMSQGDGTFETPEVVVADGVAHLFTQDFTGDGKVDLVAKPDDATIVVYPGLGDGTFGAAVTSKLTIPLDAHNLGRGFDIDDDSVEDLLVWSGSASGLYVVYGTGGGAFDPEPIAISDERVRFAHVMDVDGDQNMDLLTLIGSNWLYDVSYGNGNGTFRDEQPVSFPLSQQSSLVYDDEIGEQFVDFDNDANEDMIVRHTNSPGVSILFGTDDFSFRPELNIPVSVGAVPVKIRDLDGDGDFDLYSGLFDGYLRIIRNYGSGDMRLLPPIQLTGASAGISIADLDLDSVPDIVVLDNHQFIGVCYGLGDMQFEPLVVMSPPSYFGEAIRDVNGDTYPDLIAHQYSQVGYVVAWVTPNGPGRSFGKPVPTFIPESGDEAYADFNGDGRTDIAVLPYTSPLRLNTYFAQSDYTFAPGQELAIPASLDPNYVETNDLDGDGDTDLHVFAYGFTFTSEFIVPLYMFTFTNDGSGNFALSNSLLVHVGGNGTEALAMGIADVTGEGIPDILAYSGTRAFSLTQGLGDGTFGQPFYFRSHYTGGTIIWGDFDGDGDKDGALSGEDQTNLLLFENRLVN